MKRSNYFSILWLMFLCCLWCDNEAAGFVSIDERYVTPVKEPAIIPNSKQSLRVRTTSSTPAPTLAPTFVPVPVQGNCYTVMACNEDGSFIAMGGVYGYIVYIKQATSSTRNVVSGSFLSMWASISMSYDGNIVVYVGNGGIFYSLNQTTAMVTATIPSGYSYTNVFISGNGLVLLAIVGNQPVQYPMSIYVRSTSSIPFNPVLVPIAALEYWPQGSGCDSIAVDYTGYILAAALSNGMLYISTDRGQTWNFNTPLTLPLTGSISFFMSAYNNGSVMAISSLTTTVAYYSTNQGKSWMQSNTNAVYDVNFPTFVLYFGSLAGSGTGQNLYVTSGGSASNDLFYSSNYGQNWTYFASYGSTNNGVIVSDSLGMNIATTQIDLYGVELYTIPNVPTPSPTLNPTVFPTNAPIQPTVTPSMTPTTFNPTVSPSLTPTLAPIPPTFNPTNAPIFPTSCPTGSPSSPTLSPTLFPSVQPTIAPTVFPTIAPSSAPTIEPTRSPTATPTLNPTVQPTTLRPTFTPTVEVVQSNFLVTFPGADSMTVSMDQSGLNGVTTRGSYYLEITTNGGYTWNSISSPLSYPSYYLFSGDGNYLFIVSDSIPTIAYRTSISSGYSNWTRLNTLNTNSYVSDIAVDYTGTFIAIISATSNHYLQVSNNSGNSFYYLSTGYDEYGFPSMITVDYSGTYISIYFAFSWLIYSTDSGNTFHTPEIPPNTNNFGQSYVANYGNSTSQSQYLFLNSLPANSSEQATSVTIYRSTDGGKIWNTINVPPPPGHTTFPKYMTVSLAVSSTGQYVAFTATNYIYYSVDYGETYEVIMTVYNDAMTLTEIAMSGDGNILFVASSVGIMIHYMNGPNTLLPSMNPTQPTVFPTISLNPTSTWAPTPGTFQNVIYLPDNSIGYYHLAVSNGGDYFTVTEGDGFTSGRALLYDYGAEVFTYAPDITAMWTDICITNDGRLQVLIGNNQVYYVKNLNFSGGFSLGSFNTIETSAFVHYCALSGESGNTLVVAQYFPSTPTSFLLAIYNNTGETLESFDPVLTPINFPATTGPIADIAIDGTGSVIVAMTYEGYLYLSTNLGVSWTLPGSSNGYPNMPGMNFMYLAVSQTNASQYMSAVTLSSGNIYISNNQAQSFTSTYDSSTVVWEAISASASGKDILAVGSGSDTSLFSSNYGVKWDPISFSYPIGIEYVTGAIDPTGVVACQLMVTQSSSTIELSFIANAPTVAPTTSKPTISSAPTVSFRPTATPTTYQPTLPLFTAGWISESFYSSQDCSGVELLVQGYRVGSCFSDKDGNSFIYTCNGDIATTTWYDGNTYCGGGSTRTVEHSLNIPDYGQTGCVLIQCQPDNPSLPLSPSQSYSIGQYFNAGPDMCVNSEVFFGQVNNVCISPEESFSMYSHYPWIADYAIEGCAGPMTGNFTYYQGCLNDPPTSNSVSTSATNGGVQSLDTPTSVAFSPIFTSLRDSSDSNGGVNGFLNRYRYLVDKIPRKDNQQNSDRTLSLWYNDDDTTVFDTFAYTLYDATSPPSMMPTFAPSIVPSLTPSNEPSFEPSPVPSYPVTLTPIAVPSFAPSYQPSALPTTVAPSISYSPSALPTLSPVSASSSSSSSALSTGELAGISLGIAALVIICGVAIAVFCFGWKAFGMFSSEPDDDVTPNVEMSFDYNNPLRASNVSAKVA